jgi:hypothetical protein
LMEEQPGWERYREQEAVTVATLLL